MVIISQNDVTKFTANAASATLEDGRDSTLVTLSVSARFAALATIAVEDIGK